MTQCVLPPRSQFTPWAKPKFPMQRDEGVCVPKQGGSLLDCQVVRAFAEERGADFFGVFAGFLAYLIARAEQRNVNGMDVRIKDRLEQSKLAGVADHIACRVGDDLDQRMSAQIEGISSSREIQLYWANSSGHNFTV